VLKNIFNTIGARYFIAFLNLLLIFINSKALGRELMGLTGVVIASSAIAVVFNSILCGNTIVYFMNRYNLRCVFYPALVWAVIGSAVACCVMHLAGMLPQGYGIAVFTLATLNSLNGANGLMLLGKDKIRLFNALYIVQGLLAFIALVTLYYVFDRKTAEGYLAGIFIAYTIALIISLILLIPFVRNDKPVTATFRSVLKEMFVYGLLGGVDNLAEGLATRLNYFFVKNLGGYSNVGLLDSGTKISESVWHISNSISYMEYNSVSKTTVLAEQKRVTLQLFKLTFYALVGVMALVALVPEWLFTDYLLTAEFAGIRKVILGLSGGIVAYGSNRILSHFFIGSGRIRFSAYCSLWGLLTLLVAGFFIIPRYGVLGAAVTSSISYLCMLIFSISVFCKIANASLCELFLPQKFKFP
jgi:O-antigen/teichoic acid export membrane protein